MRATPQQLKFGTQDGPRRCPGACFGAEDRGSGGTGPWTASPRSTAPQRLPLVRAGGPPCNGAAKPCGPLPFSLFPGLKGGPIGVVSFSDVVRDSSSLLATQSAPGHRLGAGAFRPRLSPNTHADLRQFGAAHAPAHQLLPVSAVLRAWISTCSATCAAPPGALLRGICRVA